MPAVVVTIFLKIIFESITLHAGGAVSGRSDIRDGVGCVYGNNIEFGSGFSSSDGGVLNTSIFVSIFSNEI